MPDPVEYAYQIGQASFELRHRGLFGAAGWITELSCGMNRQIKDQVETAFADGRKAAAANGDKSQPYRTGLNYFHLKEYLRAANSFDKCHSVNGKFMKYYSKFRAEEKRRSGLGSLSGLRHEAFANNEVMKEIHSGLQRNVLSAGVEDAFSYFLYGLVTEGETSKEALLKSVRGFPYNWDAWTALLKHVKNNETYVEIESSLPEHWMMPFFKVAGLSQIRQYSKALNLLKEMQDTFPHTGFFNAELAKCLHFLEQNDTSLKCFRKLMKKDPERTKDMDIYARLLYVLELKTELSQLAQTFLEKHKFTPEACIIIGQNYSLKRNHKKAVDYYERAVRLDESYLSARLLMALEHIELRDYSAALRAAQQVIDRDVEDAYAWHILGQAYEFADAMTLAEEAFSRACCLRPHVGAMWLSRGICNLRMNRLEIAEAYLKRAKEEGCIDGTADTYYKEVQEKLAAKRDRDAEGAFAS